MKLGLHYQLRCTGEQSPVQRYRDTIEQASAWAPASGCGLRSRWALAMPRPSQPSETQ